MYIYNQLFLITHTHTYTHFLLQISSKALCNAVGHQDMSPYLKEEGYVRMIQCFLLPELMIRRPEAPNVLREDLAVLELTPDGRQRPIRRGGSETDPVYELFMPIHTEQQGRHVINYTY